MRRTADLECILGAQRLRQIFKCLGFVFLFVWILFGNYGPRVEENRVSTRKLLSLHQLQRDFSGNDDIECSEIHDYDEELYCEFVKKVDSCGGDEGFIAYFEFVYCLMPYKLLPLSMIILAFWLLYLFLFLGTTAEEYFCRALTVITGLLHLNQNVAGVTLLALGNGAPDIFSVLAAFNHPDEKRTSLAFGALFGAGMFVTTMVAGTVAIVRPFMLTRRPFMRDNIFYIFAVYWAFFMLWENEMNIGIAVGFLIYYAFYVVIVISGNLIYQRWLKRKAAVLKLDSSPKSQERSSTSGIIVRYLIKEKTDSDKMPSGEVVLDQKSSSEGEEEEKLMLVKRPTKPLSDESEEQETDFFEDDQERSTPTIPEERSALIASQEVYGKDTDDEHADKEGHHKTYLRPNTPHSRPQSRVDQVIDNVMDVAEDFLVGGNPNLAKMWQQTYQREKDQEKGSRGPTPRIVIEEEPQMISPSSSDDTLADIKTESCEVQPLLNDSRVLTFRQRQVQGFANLLTAVFPFGKKFRQMNMIRKIVHIIKFPINLLLVLTIPVVDKSEPLDNWNRWLNILNCIIAPIFASLTTEVGLIKIGGNEHTPVIIIVIPLALTLAGIVALTSSNDKKPIYHCVFAWASFVLSVIWIYTIANEIVNLLQVFGIVINLSDGILGITLLAWGNSIQDSVTNITMARQGYPRMAMGACFGGPLLNLLIGVGIASVVKVISEQKMTFNLYFTQVEMFAALFLLLSLSSSLLITSCLRFKMYRLYGVYLFVFYVIFLIVVILAEVEVFDIKIDGVLEPLT